jgi:hypothetical protein
MDRSSRRERLEARVRQHLARGYRIEVRTEFTARMVKVGRFLRGERRVYLSE